MKKIAMIIPVFAVAVLALTSGCGQKLPAGMPKLYPVTITLTSDGQPLVGAGVSAYTDIANFSWSIAGVTDENGQTELLTSGQYRGAPEGKLTVCVEKIEHIPGPTASLPKPTELEAIQEYNRKCGEEERQIRIVEVKYNSRATSPLEMTVVKGGNVQTFEIPRDGEQIK